ncbi:hypothetical protein [Achromobacter denitrificans]|uniref:hypothetical protein n=1 Tax=Achromobacter denitrificans TaxID=32002 RepID=UPI00146929D9|nr:hypothetical protein [Achromobacter denitrificans]CAB3812131.1 hypothetical protein LMG1860_00434 [Achromobacter denitrificans]
MASTKPSPLLTRLNAAAAAVRYTDQWHVAAVIHEASDEIKRLRRELAAEKRRPKWNGKT